MKNFFVILLMGLMTAMSAKAQVSIYLIHNPCYLS